MRSETIVKGGTVVTAADTFSRIGIPDGRIAMLAGDLDDGDEIIDATGPQRHPCPSLTARFSWHLHGRHRFWKDPDRGSATDTARPGPI